MEAFYDDIVLNNRIIIIIITAIINRHESDLEGPVSATSDSLFKGLPSRLRPFVPYFSIIFAIPLLFVLVTRRGQFDLYLLRLLPTSSTFNACKISSFFLLSKNVFSADLLEK